MPQRRSRLHPSQSRPVYRPSFEQLEDRTTPTVNAIQDPGTGILSISLDANDSATITGTDAGGTTITVTGTATPFTNVTGIIVADSGTNAGQSVTFNDSGSGAGINVSGAISVTGIETVDFATTAALQAGSVSVGGTGAGIKFDADVTTTGANGQIYNAPVLLENSTVTLSAGAAGGIAFTQAVNSDGGSKALVLNAGGVTSFTGIVGGVSPLASILTDAAGTTKLGANILTVGAQTFNDPVVLTGILVTLTSNSAGDVLFAGTVDAATIGANSLVVNTAGATTFGGAVGTTALGSLATDNAGTTLIKANISTTGTLTFNDPVTLSGAAIALSTTSSNNITFGDTLDDDVAGTTALTVNDAAGTTVFSDNVGVTKALLSITTDAGAGGTVFLPTAAAAISVITTGAQAYNDAVRLNSTSVTFSSTNNGNITFASTLDGTNSIQTDTVFNTGGETIFTGAVGGGVSLKSITTDNAAQTGEETLIQGSVTTIDDQNYGDAAVFTAATGVTAQTIASSVGNITFHTTLGGATAAPVTIRAGSNASFDGNATFSASGSRLNVQAGATGSGSVNLVAGLTFKADVQTWQAGDGAGGLSTAAIDLVTNAPTFKDSTGANAPKSFLLRQDAAITDASIPALAQFGAAPPTNYTILSDDGSLTLTSTTPSNALAGPASTNVSLTSGQTLSLGTSINGPMAIVRLRSISAAVTQTAGGITSAGLGVRSGTATTLTGTNAVTGPFAAASTTSNIQFSNGTPYTVGAIGVDPLGVAFTAVTGVAATAGTVTFSQPGTSALNVTIAAPVSGTTVTATGGTGDDRVAVNYTIGGTLANGLVFNGNGGNDTLALSDAGGTAAHTYTLGSSATRDTNAAITYSGVETVSVTGGTLADTFNVTPDATAAISATGGLPLGTTGDKLTLTLTGATAPVLTATSAADGFSGSATSSNLATVTFNQMESISPQADIQVTSSSSAAFVSPGGSSTLTVVVKNAGPDPVTGANITDLFPTGVTASWTATASSGSTVAAPSGTGDIHTTANLIASGTATFTITLTANAGFLGNVTNTFTASAGATAFDTTPANNSASSSFTVQALALTVVGAGAGGGPQVKAFNEDGSLRFSFYAYDPSYLGGVTVATGDVNGDGVEDIVTGSATSSSHVEVFDGITGDMIASFFAFPGFDGGVNVAVANGEVIAGAGNGGGPIVSGFRITGGLTQTFSMFAYDPSFRGGVVVAGSDNFITVGAGPGGGPHVKVFNADTLAVVSSFFAFPPANAVGVSVGMGSQSGRDTVIAGAGAGLPPSVVTFDAQTGKQISNILGFDAGFLDGVRTASTTTSAGLGATVVGAGPGGAPRVRVIDSNGVAILDVFAFDPSFRGGVYVG